VTEQLAAAQVFDGLMPAVIYHNDLVWHRGNEDCLICGGCCMYSGVIALDTVWRDAMTFRDGKLRINYFLDRQSPQAAMTTGQPSRGEAEIVLRRPADVLVRVPSWLRREQLAIRIDDRASAAAIASTRPAITWRWARWRPARGFTFSSRWSSASRAIVLRGAATALSGAATT